MANFLEKAYAIPNLLCVSRTPSVYQEVCSLPQAFLLLHW